eukprot:931570-Pelagomonas_calceolata.AAC.2
MSFAAPDANPHKGTFDMASGGRLAPANPGHPYRGTVVTSKHRLEAEILQEMSAGATQFLERWLAVEGLSNYWLQILSLELCLEVSIIMSQHLQLAWRSSIIIVIIIIIVVAVVAAAAVVIDVVVLWVLQKGHAPLFTRQT